MRYVVVAVLPDVPDDQGEDVRTQMLTATARALSEIQPKPVDMIAATAETADAVLEALGR